MAEIDKNGEEIEQRLRRLHEELLTSLTASFASAKTMLATSLEDQLHERQHLIELARVGAADLIAHAAVVRAFNFRTDDLKRWNDQAPEVEFRLEVNHQPVCSFGHRPEPSMQSNTNYRVLLLILPAK